MDETAGPPNERDKRMYLYRVVRYAPNLVRDEWLNIGVLLFEPETAQRRLRLISETEEFTRVRRLHPAADEALLRRLQEDLESRFEEFSLRSRNEVAPGGQPGVAAGDEWQGLLSKWDDLLSNTVQLTDSKGSLATENIDAELERLYADHVAPQRSRVRVGAPGSRATMRTYCRQVFHQAQIWDRIEPSVRAASYTFPGDPMRIDYSYRRNGTRGFVQTLSVTRSPSDAKLLAYTAENITKKSELGTEFAAITDVPLLATNERHRFVGNTLRSAGIEPVPLEGFAVWVAKLKPLLRGQ
jgi:hypothetical protein